MKARVFVILFSLAIFSSGVAAVEVNVPYDGMNIRMSESGRITCSGETTDTWSDTTIFSYQEGENGIFEVDSDVETVDYSSETREILGGEAKGLKTSHWIDPEVSVGEKIDMGNTTYSVVSVSKDVETNFGEVESIELNNRSLLDDWVTNDLDDEVGVDNRYYDKETGLFLKQELEGSYREIGTYSSVSCKYNGGRELQDTGRDFNNNGVSNLEEILVERKNPRVLEKDLNLGIDDTDVKQHQRISLEITTGEEPVEAEIYLNGDKVGTGSTSAIKLRKAGVNKLKVEKNQKREEGIIYNYNSDSTTVDVEKLDLVERFSRALSNLF